MGLPSSCSSIRTFQPSMISSRKTMPFFATPIHFQPIQNLHLCKKSASAMRLHQRLVPQCTEKPAGDEGHDDNKVPERLYAAIRNRNLQEFLDLIRDQSRDVRKEQVLAMLSSMVAFIANHAEFVIKPNTHGRPEIGIRWSFDWKQNNIPLGPFFSLYTVHVYNGKIQLRNGRMLLESLLHMEPLRLKMMEFVMPILEMIVPQSVLAGNAKAIFLIFLLSLVFIVILFIL